MESKSESVRILVTLITNTGKRQREKRKYIIPTLKNGYKHFSDALLIYHILDQQLTTANRSVISLWSLLFLDSILLTKKFKKENS